MILWHFTFYTVRLFLSLLQMITSVCTKHKIAILFEMYIDKYILSSLWRIWLFKIRHIPWQKHKYITWIIQRRKNMDKGVPQRESLYEYNDMSIECINSKSFNASNTFTVK